MLRRFHPPHVSEGFPLPVTPSPSFHVAVVHVSISPFPFPLGVSCVPLDEWERKEEGRNRAPRWATKGKGRRSTRVGITAHVPRQEEKERDVTRGNACERNESKGEKKKNHGGVEKEIEHVHGNIRVERNESSHGAGAKEDERIQRRTSAPSILRRSTSVSLVLAPSVGSTSNATNHADGRIVPKSCLVVSTNASFGSETCTSSRCTTFSHHSCATSQLSPHVVVIHCAPSSLKLLIQRRHLRKNERRTKPIRLVQIKQKKEACQS